MIDSNELAEGLADTTTRLGFAVESLRQVVDKLAEAGTAVVANAQETEWGFRAVVRDPDGRAVELCERREK
jgi:predicted enzyme related to lactoylglutathione lyase